MSVSFPGESADYRAARDRLLAQEVALRREMEAVAEARRALPPGGRPLKDYLFEGEAGPMRLSELFEPGKPLAIYSFMFPRAGWDGRPGPTEGSTAALALGEGPCPSCVALLDQWDPTMPHVAPVMTLVVAVRAPLARALAYKAERGWRHLRIVSCGANSYSRDYHAEDDDGGPLPMVNVFQRDDDGRGGGGVRHFWGSELLYAPADPGQDPRHLGTVEPMWTLIDLTPEGRPAGFEEQLAYDDCCARQ